VPGRFFDPEVPSADAGQGEVWRACGEELVAQCLAGHNGTLLAYGQTGSGKTYTMGTDGGRCAAVWKKGVGLPSGPLLSAVYLINNGPEQARHSVELTGLMAATPTALCQPPRSQCCHVAPVRRAVPYCHDHNIVGRYSPLSSLIYGPSPARVYLMAP